MNRQSRSAHSWIARGWSAGLSMALGFAVALGFAAWSDTAEARDWGAIAKPTHRSGYTTGFSTGLLLGSGQGYSNDDLLLRPDDTLTRMGQGAGLGGSLWLGVQLTDWLGVSFGASRGQWRDSSLLANVSAFQLRVDTYPLFDEGGEWKNVGLTASVGVGRFRVQASDGRGLVRGNETSAIGLGVFYQPLRFWGIAMGPQLEYNYQFSIGFAARSAVLGWRTSFHSGPD